MLQHEAFKRLRRPLHGAAHSSPQAALRASRLQSRLPDAVPCMSINPDKPQKTAAMGKGLDRRHTKARADRLAVRGPSESLGLAAAAPGAWRLGNECQGERGGAFLPAGGGGGPGPGSRKGWVETGKTGQLKRGGGNSPWGWGGDGLLGADGLVSIFYLTGEGWTRIRGCQLGSSGGGSQVELGK